MNRWKEDLKKIKDLDLHYKSELKRHTTFGIGGPAEVFAEPQSEESLQALVQLVQKEKIPFYVLGGGSNVLFGDEEFEGIVISMKGFQREIWNRENLILGAGFSTSAAVKTAAFQGWSGWEVLVGIPGTMGGALAMNAGGKYGAISDTLLWVRWMDWEGKIHIQKKEKIPFSYRRSNIPGIVLEGAFSLAQSEREKVQMKTAQILQEKKSTQPLGKRSAGCFFMNPPGESAGRLIEKAGFKGFSLGGAQVSQIHANFILNQEAARAEDIYRLVKMIQEKVERESGFFLHTEVKMVNVAIQSRKVA